MDTWLIRIDSFKIMYLCWFPGTRFQNFLACHWRKKPKVKVEIVQHCLTSKCVNLRKTAKNALRNSLLHICFLLNDMCVLRNILILDISLWCTRTFYCACRVQGRLVRMCILDISSRGDILQRVKFTLTKDSGCSFTTALRHGKMLRLNKNQPNKQKTSAHHQ